MDRWQIQCVIRLNLAKYSRESIFQMEQAEINQAFELLNQRLAARSSLGEICIYGGAAMCLAYAARPSTKDVNAVFQPVAQVREAALEVAAALGLPDDWINDGVKGFLVDHPRSILREYSNLRLFVPSAEYLFAMKALAALVDTSDRTDLKLLLRELGFKTAAEGMACVEKYYPKSQLRPATQFFIEEIFEEA